jgi:hypothetical protein
MLARPESSLAAVINLLGVYLIVIGALRLLQAVDAWHRRRREGAGLTTASPSAGPASP